MQSSLIGGEDPALVQLITGQDNERPGIGLDYNELAPADLIARDAMTSRLFHREIDLGTLERFPDFPPRDDMQNMIHLHYDGLLPVLRRLLGNEETILILGEVPVRWTPSQLEGHRIPDMMIALDVNVGLVYEQNGFSIRDQGKPPDFVLEVASETTGRQDVTDKRTDYSAFGIREYWRFDPTGGRRHDAPLAGDRLVDGAYEPIEIIELEPQHLHGHSTVLNLDACWDHGKLRWHNPSSGEHLLTVEEELDARDAEREVRIAEQQARIVEREARIAAEARVLELEEQLRARDQG